MIPEPPGGEAAWPKTSKRTSRRRPAPLRIRRPFPRCHPGTSHSPAGGGAGPPPSLPPIDRMTIAWQRRTETDYIFDYWTALGWTVLTLGIYGLYVFYQLVRRMRDHNARRVELLDASLALAWDEAGRRGSASRSSRRRSNEPVPTWTCSDA